MKTTKAIILIALIAFISSVSAQSININQNFTSDAEIFPFDPNDTIYGLSITGSVTLNSDTSLVRIILADTNYYEYMAYEAYPLIVDTFSFDTTGVCDETCYLDGINPYSIEIQIIDAGFDFQSIELTYGYVDNADSLRRVEKESVEWNKVNKMNNILSDNWLWGADTNQLSSLLFSDKKESYGNKYNLQGYEYCSGGIFHMYDAITYPKDNSSFLTSFDWRNRHGANDTSSPYYIWENGFITQLKNQNDLCRVSCWLFAALAVLEANMNLYFNKENSSSKYLPVNPQLSEQHYLSCINPTGICKPGNPQYVFSKLLDSSIVDETCCNRQDNSLNNGETATTCDELIICQEPDYKIGLVEDWVGSYNLRDTKKRLINYGPLAITLKRNPLDHKVCLIGYEVLLDGDTIYRGRNLDPLIIDKDSEWLYTTWYKYKDSDGPVFDSLTYHPDSVSSTTISMEPPIMQYGTTILNRLYLDLDEDGYYNWGIGKKPDSVSYSHPNIDSDDNNPRIGPRDTNYIGLPVKPEIKVSYENWGAEIPIEANSVHTFEPGITQINFKIKNVGSAQLNLKEELTGAGPIYCEGNDANDFYVHIEPDTNQIRIHGLTGDTRQFSIRDSSGTQDKKVCEVRIALDECDMSDFVFTLAIANCDSAYNTTYVTRDTIWNNNNVFIGDVTVNSDVNLTIKSTIGFGENASLNILPGARVVIDSGKLTKACSGLWQGIDVYGYPFTSQSYEDYHGILRIINNGTVEYAHTGIETREVDPESTGYAGGIIKIDSGTIRNNITGIKFRPFQNTKPGTGEPWPNVSYIKNCTFLTDTGLVNLQATPEQHISFLGVSGIPVTACTFYNTTQPQQDPAELGKGILSLDADFFMNGKCVEHDPQTFECTKWQQSRFANLDYGVYAINTHSNSAPTIKRTLFEKNITGIYLSMTPQASVTLCDFDISKLDFFPSNEHFSGLYLNAGCDGFQVEENYFYNSDSDPFSGSDSTIGIVVNNSGAVSNEVYNNYFEDLDYGVSAQGTNKGESTGLQIKCNDFDSCEYNIVVVPDSCVGIYYYQGSDTALATGSANNLFSYMGSIEYVDLNDINNMGEFITYYYPPNYGTYRVKPIYIDTLKVGTEESTFYEEWFYSAGCPSNLTSIDTSIQEIRSLSVLYENKADSINAQLQELEDGGNTEELNTDIQTSWPEDAYDVYSELIYNSPYLSDSVMVSAVKKEDVLSGTMVTDVLSANPQAAKRDTVMDAVYKRNNPLNNDQLNQVNQGLSQIGLKEKLEAELSFYKTKKAYYNSSLLRFFRKDTSLTSINDSIISVYKRINNVDAKYQLAIEYLWLEDTINAKNTLDSIPFKFTLNNNQTAQHTDYEDYFNWIIEIIADGRDAFSADSTEIEELYEIYNNASGKPKCLTRNLLIQIDALTYYEPYYFPTFYKSSKIAFPENRQSNENKYLFIYPNPSNSYYYVECKLEKEFYNSLVTISDINGRLIDEILMDCQSFRTIIDARDYKPGLYVGRLYSEGKIIESAKFIVIH